MSVSIGKKIKQLRELRNYTQLHMAENLGMTVGGYGKIERDETDVTIGRLNRIAEILETDISAVLNFDSSHVFNQYNNKNAAGIVQNQQIIGDNGLGEIFDQFKKEISDLKEQINQLKTKVAK
ncbi:MAG: helix-turn-helix transcriptional regulator [Crocinitomicaceae bacterium]|nr:helix-turn-helix transcriptional regulator [Crocinitomicaceae bacterium]